MPVPAFVAAIIGAIGSQFFKGQGSETVDRTDPTLVNQIAALTTRLETQMQTNAQELERYTREMKKLEDEKMKHSKQMEDLQKRYNDVAENEEKRKREAELLKNYPKAWFQDTPFWKKPGTVHVGFVGRCGIGKSTLVNTLRGLRACDEGAAEVSNARECTLNPTPYEYLQGQQRVVFWDLPGCGTKKFPTETYLRDMGVRYFNYMILMTDHRPFCDAEIKLMNEMDEHEIPFAMVRGRMDDVERWCEENGKPFDVEKEIIRGALVAAGIKNIFLISNWLSQTNNYEYPELLSHVKENLKLTL